MGGAEPKARSERYSGAKPLTIAIVASLHLFGARAALAETPTRLVYSRAPDAATCPEESVLREGVIHRLGRDPFVTDAGGREIEVSISRADSTYRGLVRVREVDGTWRADRTLESGGECQELVDALALAISIAMDPSVVLRPEPDTSRAGTAPVSRPEKPKGLVTEKTRLSAEVGIGPTISVGGGPALVAGGALFGSVRYGLVGALIEGRGSFSGSTVTPGGEMLSSSAALLGGPCGHLAPFYACGCAELDFVTARLDGDRGREASTRMLRLGARLGIAVPIANTAFSARAYIEGLAAVPHHRLLLGGSELYAYGPGRLGMGVAIGLQF